MDDTFIAEENALRAQVEALDAVRGNYIIKVGEGYRALSDRDVEHLAASVGLHVLMEDSGGLTSGPAEAPSQLGLAVYQAIEMTSVERDKLSNPGSPDNLVDLADYAAGALNATLEAFTKKNYAEIAKRKRALEAQIASNADWREWIGEWVNHALALREGAPSDATQAGFLSGEGYYVVRLSGGGWIKKGAGYATYSSGHEYFGVWVDDGRTEPVKKYYWEFPVGFDARNQFALWIDEKEEASRKACRDTPALGPVTRPHIWVEGPRYEVVYGPYSGQTPEQFGSRRINNGEPGSALQWTHESGKIADVKAACNALGAPF